MTACGNVPHSCILLAVHFLPVNVNVRFLYASVNSPLIFSSYVEALMYLIYAYQYNKELLSKGPYRGHDEELIAHYRRECLLVSVCAPALAAAHPFTCGQNWLTSC